MAKRLKTNPVTPGLKVEENQPYKPPAVGSFDPVTREVDPTKETVSGQMRGLLGSENPYIKEARQRGVEMANKRGLLNSSIAASAAEREAIKAALPMAQQDAGTYFQQGRANQDIGAQFKGREQSQTYKQSLMDVGQQQQLEQMQADAAIRGQIMDLDSQIRERLSAIEQGYALDLESLKQNYEIEKNIDTQMGSMYADGLKSISTFLDNPDMSKAQQTTGLNAIIDNLQAGLNFLAGITGQPKTVQGVV